VRETAGDLDRLQHLLDRSYEAAGSHLREVITPERRLSARALAERLEGMCLLVLATATADGRPISGPVDGFFYRGSWYFGSSPDSLRVRHIRRRPQVSATHLPSEAFSVTVHGRATEIDLPDHDGGAFRRLLLDTYGPHMDGDASAFIDSGPVYARIEAERMFTFAMDVSSP
jgi:hypothetical protein